MTQNRRYFSRIKLTGEQCLIALFDKQLEVQLVDQSIGGVCIQGLDLVNLIHDEEVIVVIQDEEFKGNCRSARRDSDGNLRIGIQWDKRSVNANEVILNTYVQSKGYHFLCDIQSVADGDRYEIQLCNEVLHVEKSMLESFTREDRMEHIRDEKLQELLIQLYGMPKNSSIEAIVDREFLIVSPRKVKQVTWVDGNCVPVVG